jgi:DNA (cytosine-5)-methyltransferase 1
MRVASLFTGAGGLDLGFKLAGFEVIWANEYDKTIWGTFTSNFPDVKLVPRNIAQISSREIPDVEGIIGGPPCQSWSEAGAKRGIKDARGQLFYEYIRILNEKRPLFFLAENVSGLLFQRHKVAFENILNQFHHIGYNVKFYLLNAKHYNVPQDRERVIMVGYRKDLGIYFQPPKIITNPLLLKDSIWDLRDNAVSAKENNKTNGASLAIPNHEYWLGGFSPHYLSRNRVRGWDEQSYTIQASGRHAPLHPQAPKMILVGRDKRIFVPEQENLYRRLTIRECARIQTFPDSFVFDYCNLSDGYKMVGNAVPVEFARQLALKIYKDLSTVNSSAPKINSVMEASFVQLALI